MMMWMLWVACQSPDAGTLASPTTTASFASEDSAAGGTSSRDSAASDSAASDSAASDSAASDSAASDSAASDSAASDTGPATPPPCLASVGGTWVYDIEPDVAVTPSDEVGADLGLAGCDELLSVQREVTRWPMELRLDEPTDMVIATRSDELDEVEVTASCLSDAGAATCADLPPLLDGDAVCTAGADGCTCIVTRTIAEERTYVYWSFETRMETVPPWWPDPWGGWNGNGGTATFDICTEATHFELRASDGVPHLFRR